MPENNKEHPSSSKNLFARPLTWWVIAFAVIVLGYVDLARGGISLAPVLLIAGYCVFVPIAILR